MQQHRFSLVLAVLLLALVTVAAPRTASGQGAARSPVFIALPETFPDLDARAVLMLEPGRDIVILDREDAGPETLAAALGVLERMHRDHPRAQDRGQLVPITGFVSRRALDPERREELEAALAALAERPLANVGNLGLGRWMRFR